MTPCISPVTIAERSAVATDIATALMISLRNITTIPRTLPAMDSTRMPPPQQLPRLRLPLVGLLVGCALALLPLSEAEAMPRIAVQADGGVSLPPLPAARNTVGLSGPRTEGDQIVGTPYLADRNRRSGLRLGVGLQLSAIEIRYAFERSTWSSESRHCIGTSPAALDGAGRVSDRGIAYDCSGAPQVIDASADDFPALVIHNLSAGYRWYAPSYTFGELYAVGGTGLALTTFDRDAQRKRIRAGGILFVGGGLDIPVERSIALVLDLRYQLTLFPVTSRFSDHARRASASGRPVTTAIFDAQHAILLHVGLRVAFR